jgi:glycine/D-amino acid oxidase-like deaminating enzyme
MLVLEPDPEASAATTAHFDAVGVSWERWSAQEVRQRASFLDVGAYGPPKPVTSDEFFAPARGVLGGTWTPDAGYVDDATLAAHNLAAAARLHGAGFQLRHDVTGLEPAGSRRWRVHTRHPGGSDAIDCDVLVNAAGPWSGAVNALAGAGADFAVTSRPMRQEVHWLPAPSEEGLTLALADPDLGVYLRPTTEGILVGGMEPECDPLEWLVRPEDAGQHVTAATYEAQTVRAARRVRNLTVPNRPTGIVGVYDVSTDWAPIYDRTAHPGYYVAMGTSGNQFKNAPVVGQLMAALVAAVEGGHDHDRDPLVWTAPRTGQRLALSTYSRLRRVDPDAPTNVMG